MRSELPAIIKVGRHNESKRDVVFLKSSCNILDSHVGRGYDEQSAGFPDDVACSDRDHRSLSRPWWPWKMLRNKAPSSPYAYLERR